MRNCIFSTEKAIDIHIITIGHTHMQACRLKISHKSYFGKYTKYNFLTGSRSKGACLVMS